MALYLYYMELTLILQYHHSEVQLIKVVQVTIYASLFHERLRTDIPKLISTYSVSPKQERHAVLRVMMTDWWFNCGKVNSTLPV